MVKSDLCGGGGGGGGGRLLAGENSLWRGLVPPAALPLASHCHPQIQHKMFSVHFYYFKAFEGLTVYSGNTILD